MELVELVALGARQRDDRECPFEHKKPKKVENELRKNSEKLGTRTGERVQHEALEGGGGKVTSTYQEDQKLTNRGEE